jgi:hypothetical protein
MKPKQLANLLTRILGLSFCAHGVPAVIAAIIAGIISLIHAMQDGNPTGAHSQYWWGYSMTYWITSVIEFATGIYLIVRSRWLVDKLFKDEAE